MTKNTAVCDIFLSFFSALSAEANNCKEFSLFLRLSFEVFLPSLREVHQILDTPNQNLHFWCLLGTYALWLLNFRFSWA